MSEKVWPSVGMRCVCVDAGEHDGWKWPDGEELTYRKIYTVYSVFRNSITGDDNIDLAEIGMRTKASAFWNAHVGYFVGRFRPLVTRTQAQDMEVFRQIADNLPSTTDLEKRVDAALARIDLP